MVRQSDFPDKWTGECPQKKVKVEVRVPLSDEEQRRRSNLGAEGGGALYEWIEIPTQEVEQYTEKGEAARIQRATKVRFPTEWGKNDDSVLHNSPKKLITQFGDSEAFMWARVSWRRQVHDDAEYVYTHFGWIGGLGQSSDPMVSKFWIYDPAELLSGAAVGVTFNFPTITQAAEKIARLTNDNTPIPLSEVEIVPPNTEEEFAILVDQISDRDISGRTVGPFEEEGGQHGAVYYYKEEQAGPDDFILDPVGEGQNFKATVIETGATGTGRPGGIRELNTKTFKSNHTTLQDVYDWMEKKTGAKMHLEPQPDGRSVRLVIDIVPERRIFAQDSVVRRQRADSLNDRELALVGGDARDYKFHEIISVLKNDALYEMKPINTVTLDGETGAGFLDDTIDWVQQQLGDVGAKLTDADPPSSKYPYAKVQSPALLEAAEGVEMGPRRESDAYTEEEVIAEAKQKLSKLLEETSEGEIVLKGEPRLMPFDAVDSFEVCNDFVVVEGEPVRYEVESVQHTAKPGHIYKTRVLVSVWANEENIEVVESGMAEVDTGSGD